MATRKHDPVQPDSNDQSGSTGRHTDKDDLGTDKDAGQDRYGQTGLGSKDHRETIGQKSYRESGGQRKSIPDSNRGSGTAEDESVQGKKRPKP